MSDWDINNPPTGMKEVWINGEKIYGVGSWEMGNGPPINYFVTDGKRCFMTDSKEDAEWLLEQLSKILEVVEK